MDRDETVKLLFLGIPALVLSLSLFTSAFRVGDMLVWYFREIKVQIFKARRKLTNQSVF
ncbi:unnamed protein product, partial [Oikopleura dioica]